MYINYKSVNVGQKQKASATKMFRLYLLKTRMYAPANTLKGLLKLFKVTVTIS